MISLVLKIRSVKRGEFPQIENPQTLANFILKQLDLQVVVKVCEAALGLGSVRLHRESGRFPPT